MESVDHILEYREPTDETVVDARGQVVALVRLRDRLGVAPCPPAAPAIVVVRLRGRAAALVVDDVHEVILVGFERCGRPPAGAEHLDAVVPLDGRLLMILDLPALLGLQPTRAARQRSSARARRSAAPDAAAPAVHPDCTGL
jgi:chemotaxis signal transduction protein